MKTKKENLESALRMVKEVDSLNETYLKMPEFTDYSVPVLRSVQACEMILVVLLQEKGVDVEDDGRVIVDGKTTSVLGYFAKNTDFLPKQCSDYIDTIRKFRNQSAHLGEITYDDMVIFKKAFDCFASWFSINVSDEAKDITPYLYKMIEYKLEDIGIILEVDDVKTLEIQQQNRMLLYAHLLSEAKKKKLKEDKEVISAEILSKLDQILQNQDKEDKKIDEIKGSIDILADEIRKLSGQIEGYQSLVERQLKLASDDEEEIEHIIHSYVDECSVRIVNELKNSYGVKEQETEEAKLIVLLGESAWEKMDESSKSFLISARVMYNSLIRMKSKIDYSGVCLLVTKALEVELSKRFFKGFVAYMKSNYPGKSKLKEWPIGLLDRAGNPLVVEKFSMGNISEILCKWHDPKCSDEQRENNRSKLLEYTSANLFLDKSDEEIMDLLLEYADEIEHVKNNYRNPSAHTGELNKMNAKDCFDLVLDVEKLLRRMLDSFNE